MTNLLIVDDEPIICQGLVATVPWQTIEVDVVAEAHNGAQAIDVLKEHEVDIVLTDVRMPKMDGLALAEYIQKEMPHVQVVMISGYDEFEYAQKAIRFGVKDYLLKPVNIDELLILIRQLIEDIKSVNEQENSSQEEIWRQISDQMFQRSNQSQEKYDGKETSFCYRVINCQTVNYAQLMQNKDEEELKDIQQQLRTVVQEGMNAYQLKFFSFFMHDNEIVSILYVQEEEGELTREVVRDLYTTICEQWEQPIIFGVSKENNRLADIKEAYHATTSIMECNPAHHKGIYIDPDDRREKPAYTYPQDIETKMLDGILRQDTHVIKEAIDMLRKTMEKKGLFLDQALQLGREIITVINCKVKERNNDKSHTDVLLQLQEKLDLKVYNRLDTIVDLLQEDLLRMTDQKPVINEKNWLIQQAKQYIQERYQLNVKASEVAESLFITPNYFSILFRKETGLSFSEYLNKLRIDKAKELLSETPNRVFEIAEFVGYREYKYFVHVFKKHTGVTPTDYRRLHASH
jgi:two-component system, response regulator YesN